MYVGGRPAAAASAAAPAASAAPAVPDVVVDGTAVTGVEEMPGGGRIGITVAAELAAAAAAAAVLSPGSTPWGSTGATGSLCKTDSLAAGVGAAAVAAGSRCRGGGGEGEGILTLWKRDPGTDTDPRDDPGGCGVLVIPLALPSRDSGENAWG